MSGRVAEHEVDRPFTLQTWSELTYLHWRFDPQTVQRLLPPGLSVEVLDGSAWIALVPFVMRDVRVPGLPRLPQSYDFPELNVRTYVRGPDGHDGVYFVNLYSPRRAVNLVGQVIGASYRYAQTRFTSEGDVRTYGFRRTSDPTGRPMFGARVEIGEPLSPEEQTPLVDSLTGRWNAYGYRLGRLLRVPVEHEPWPLRHATAKVRTDLFDAYGLARPHEEPLVHYSPGVHARFGVPVVAE